MSDDVLRAATKVILTWGPERMIPERERLLREFPNLTEQEIETALSAGRTVLRDAEELAPGIKQGSTHGTKSLRQTHPWLNEELAGSAITQGLYYHWRETGE